MGVLPRLGRVLPLFAVTAPAWARTAIGDPLSDSTADSLTTGNVDVVEFERDRRFTVDGTLVATSGGPLDVLITDDRDDMAGGDTNGAVFSSTVEIPVGPKGWIRRSESAGGC